MINTDISGVAFTRNVVNPLDREHMLISATYGLCEGVVSGEISTDEYTVNREDLSYKEKINSKTDRLIPDFEHGGTKKVANEADLVKKSSLTQQQIEQLTKELLKIERLQGAAQDCEWGFEQDQLYLLQARPITSLPPDEFFDELINGEQYNLWDNSNIIESYNGVTTPLTFSFASFAYRQVYVQFHQIMGVPESIIRQEESMYRNMLGLVRGRIFYNLIHWYKLVLLLPGAANNGSFMETMMGVKQGLTPEVTKLFAFMENPPKYSLLLRMRVTLSTLYRFIRIDSIVRRFKDEFNDVYEKGMNSNFQEKSLTELGQYYNFLEEEVLKKWHAPIINDYLCMIFFGLLKKLTGKWIDSENADTLQNDLLCGQGDLESMEPTKWLMRTSKEIDQSNPHLRQLFLENSLEDLKKNKEVLELLAPFLYKYGFRCADELKLESNDLHDDPSFAINAIQSYIKMKSYDISKMEENERKILERAEREVKTKLSGKKLWFYNWVLKQTRKAVANREDLRFLRTKIFGICRQVFRTKGKKFQQLGLITEANDIFYLTTDEIMAFIEGRSLGGDFKVLIAERKKVFAEFAATPAPPERFLSKGCCSYFFAFPQVLSASDLLASQRRVSDDPNTLLGTSCCPGEVEGVVRVVHNIEDAQDLNGEILVTERTDPGWVPLYPTCSGILIERGSLLSHSAVVARELGIPTIVGVDGGLVSKLKSGDRVKVNATIGEIKIIRE
jgi:pyruvate,water dikinase